MSVEEQMKDLTEIIKTASDKAELAVKNGVEYDGDIKGLVAKSAEMAEDIQKTQLAQKELKDENENLEKLLSRSANGGDGDSQEAILKYNREVNAYYRKGDEFKPAQDTVDSAVKAFVASNIGTDNEEIVEACIKTMQSGSNADGGYLVLPVRRSGIKDIRQFETSPMRSVAEVVTIGSDEYEIILDDDESASGGWVGEITARPETVTAQVGILKIATHEQYAEPKVTTKFLDDATINVEGHIADKTNGIFTRIENSSFVTGDGASKPKGFLTYDDYTAAGVYERNKIEQFDSGTNGQIEYASLIRLQNGLKSSYQNNAVWMLQRSSWEQILLLNDTQNRPLLRPDLLLNGAELRLLGKPVIFADDMPVAATDSLSVAYGDFAKSYTIVDRMGIRTLRDPLTDKRFVKFYSTKRTGGAVTNFEGIKLLKLAA